MMLMTAAQERMQIVNLPAKDRVQAEDIPQENVLTLAGYASRFGQIDLSGDCVKPGAFSAALLGQSENLPMLFNHETDTPIGVWDEVFEDDIGLFVKGRLFLERPEAASIARLITSGSLSGLSIGFRTRRYSPRSDGGRDLFDLELWEVSIVAFPMLRSARLTEISSPVTNSTILDDVLPLPQANEI